MDQRINLMVDGKSMTVNADPAMPLLYALHSELGLNTTLGNAVIIGQTSCIGKGKGTFRSKSSLPSA